MPGRNGGTLRRAEKGEVLNPKGRGKGRLNNKTILHRWLGQEMEAINPATKKTQIMTALDAITIALIGQALNGDARAYKELLDRMDGKARQEKEPPPDDGGPLKQEVSWDIDYDALPSETLRQIKAARTKNHDG